MNWNDFRLIPTITMSFEEKLFTIIKLFFFISIISALLFNDIKYVLFVIILLFIFIIIYNFYLTTLHNNENFLNNNSLDIIDNKICVKPNIDNPFMNPNILDYQSGDIKPSSCSIDNSKIKEDIDSNFRKRIFKDVNDIYHKFISDRQFYTVPCTSIPNEQGEFSKWLYTINKTCKENNGNQCYNNII